MRIRNGTSADAESIAALHTASWRSAYRVLMPAAYLDGPLAAEHLAKWRDRTAEPSDERCLLLAEQEGEPLGFIHLAAGSDGRVHVDNLHARPDHVGTGVGRTLLHHGFAWAAGRYPGRDVYLEVLRGNARAISFYERAGGRRTAERPLRMAAGFTLEEFEYTWPAATVGRYGDGRPAPDTVPPPTPG
ncbi:GNAT family N-acetyltransferase [Streptomyces sp. ME02-8801-2C]|uniref:GNAT family N-acetyltransferase n=1 Tax=Streptomyces sp. ME02-8801-2C TaxID=3028680 RepID=UPI0029A8FC83|nr:GNAT family N-acetyltransferase [Streptomyces sp. ME02-8801-2C]MDX3451289.1 GNAT family N-acetyltransferase [Streptomyces sp. ME02-8801-2C]